MNGDVLVRVEGVSKKFCRNLKRSLWYGVKDGLADLSGRGSGSEVLRPGEFWALNDVSFELRRGECLGLVGRNGAGKTTLLKMLTGLIKPDGGRIEMRGRIGAIIALGAGFNPVLTGRENIRVNAALLGIGRRELSRKIDEIVEFAGIGESIDSPVQSYSSGMQVRLGFAVATAMEPDVLLLDEVLAVGDAAFRARCFERIGKMLDRAAVVFVSHNEAQIYRICNQAILLSNGRDALMGSPDEVLARYRAIDAGERAQSSIVLDSHVSELTVAEAPEVIEYGSQYRTEIDVAVYSPCDIGAMFFHFWRNGEFVASGEIVYEPGQAMSLAAGVNRLRLVVDAVQLQAGTYSVSLAAFDRSRKRTVFQWLHYREVTVCGPVGSGPAYRLSVYAECLT